MCSLHIIMPRTIVILVLLFCACNAQAGLLERLGLQNFLSSVNGTLNNIAETLKESFKLMETSKICVPVPFSTLLLESVRLCFFYGSGKSDYFCVPISDAKNLVSHMKWKQDHPIVIYTFGWLHSPTISYTQELVKSYMNNGNFNLIVVDWQVISHIEYGMAVTMVPRVGKLVAGGLQDLLNTKARLGHIVGHSLGAQISGHIARNLQNRPRFVIGLDPAGPLFYPTMFKCQDPLSSSDAEYVVSVHTDWNRLGANQFTGPVDFMPNNGHRLQPGCSLLDSDSFGPLCSHTHALFFWCDAIRNLESMVGRLCSSWDMFESKTCSRNSLLYMAEHSNATGVYYLKTNNQAPYGLGRSGV